MYNRATIANFQLINTELNEKGNLHDENPVCMETMSIVAEDLLDKFDIAQNGWVLLVGDGKTY